MRCAGRCGAIVAEMTDRSPEHGRRLALDFLELGARRRISAIGHDQARQEALSLAAVRSSLGVEKGVGADE
jgi:glycerol-3-phosphate dehydrogenase